MTVQYCTWLYNTMQCSTVLDFTVQCGAVLYLILQYNAVQYCTWHNSTKQCSTVHEPSVQCSVIQYSRKWVLRRGVSPKGRLTLSAPPSHRIPQQTSAPPLAKTCQSRLCCAETSKKFCGLKQNSLNGFIALLSAAQLSSAKCFLFAY